MNRHQATATPGELLTPAELTSPAGPTVGEGATEGAATTDPGLPTFEQVLGAIARDKAGAAPRDPKGSEFTEKDDADAALPLPVAALSIGLATGVIALPRTTASAESAAGTSAQPSPVASALALATGVAVSAAGGQSGPPAAESVGAALPGGGPAGAGQSTEGAPDVLVGSASALGVPDALDGRHPTAETGAPTAGADAETTRNSNPTLGASASVAQGGVGPEMAGGAAGETILVGDLPAENASLDPGNASAIASSAEAIGTTPTGASVEPRTDVRVADLARGVPSQVLPYLAQANVGGAGILVRLEPPLLGSVVLRIAVVDGRRVRVQFQVEDSAVGDALAAGWGQLAQALADRGLSPEGYVIDLQARAGPNAPSADGHDGFGSRADGGQPGRPEGLPSPLGGTHAERGGVRVALAPGGRYIDCLL